MSIEAMRQMVAALEDIKDDCCGDEFEWQNDYPLQCAALEAGRKAIADIEEQSPVARVDEWPHAEGSRIIVNLKPWDEIPIGALLYCHGADNGP